MGRMGWCPGQGLSSWRWRPQRRQGHAWLGGQCWGWWVHLQAEGSGGQRRQRAKPACPPHQPRLLAQTTSPRLRSSKALWAICPRPRAPRPQTVGTMAPPPACFFTPRPEAEPLSLDWAPERLGLSPPPDWESPEDKDCLLHQLGAPCRDSVSPSDWELTDTVSAHSD